MTTTPRADEDRQGSTRPGLFVSYSRKDHAFAEALAAALSARGYGVWIDLEGIRPSEDWMNAIHAAIEGCDSFVFVVSPDSVDPASVCKVEIEHALACGKRLIPVLCRAVDTRSVAVPEAIARLNWILLEDPAALERGMSALQAAIETDLDWTRWHTRLTVRASEWQRSGKDDSFVLQKNDLLAAEGWLKQALDKHPAVTGLQTEFILQSRASAESRRRRLVFGVAVAFVVAATGLTVAGFQAREASQRRIESQARALASEAQVERTRRLDRAIVLAARALATRSTAETVDAALAVGHSAFDVQRILRGHEGPVLALCLLAQGRLLVSSGEDGQVIVWDADTGDPVRRLAGPSREQRVVVACDAQGSRLAWVPRPDRLEVRSESLAGSDLVWGLDHQGLSAAEPPLLAFSADGDWLAVAVGDTVSLRTAADGRVGAAALRMPDTISALAVAPDARWLALGTRGSDTIGYERPGRLALWERGAPAPALLVDAFPLAVRGVGVAPDGSRIVGIDIEGTIEGYARDGAKADLLISSKLGLGGSRVTAFDGSSAQFVVGDGQQAFALGRPGVPGYLEQQPLAGHARPLSAAAIHGAGGRAATASEDGVILLHRLRSANDLQGGTIVADSASLAGEVSFSSDGRSLVLPAGAGAPARAVPLAPAATSSPASAARAAAPPFVVEQAMERALLKSRGDGRIWSELVPEPGQPVSASAVTPDGKTWAAATDAIVRLRGADGVDAVAAMLPAGFGLISALALRPDGKLAAVGGGDRSSGLGLRLGMTEMSIALVDTGTGRSLGLPLTGLGNVQLEKLEFSPDGRSLLSVGSTVAVWLVDPQALSQRACAALTRAIDAAEWQRRLPGVPVPATC